MNIKSKTYKGLDTCLRHPLNIDKTLCGESLSALNLFEETTDPITCPDCLAIIRECKSQEMPGMQVSGDGYTETSRQFAQDHDIMTTMLTE